MHQDEVNLQQSVVDQARGLQADLCELKRLLLMAQREAEIDPNPSQGAVWLLDFLPQYGLPTIDSWQSETTKFANDPALLFSAEALSSIGKIKAVGRVLDSDFSWSRQRSKLGEVSDRISNTANDIYKTIYYVRHPVQANQ